MMFNSLSDKLSQVDDNKDKECEIQKLQSNVNGNLKIIFKYSRNQFLFVLELTLKMQDEQRLCLKLDNEAKLLGVKAESNRINSESISYFDISWWDSNQILLRL